MPNYDFFGDQTAEGGSSYAVGADLGGQTNAPGFRWNYTGTTFGPSKPIIDEEGLSYSGLPAGSGGSVAFTPTANADPIRGGGARLNLGITSAGTAYYSLLLKITDLSKVPSYNTNNAFVAFCDDPAEQGAAVARLGTRLLCKQSGTGYVLGIGSNNTLADYRYDDTVFNIGDVVLVVASYELSLGVSTNVNLWINPDPATFATDNPPVPDATAVISVGGGNINTQGPRALGIFCQFAHAPSGKIDEVRVGSTWSQVTGGIAFALQPSDTPGVVGSNVTFTAFAVGAAPLTYRWQKEYQDLPDSAPYYGVTTRTLTISNVTHAHAGLYMLTVSNGSFGAVSAPATLTVSDPVLDPIITTQPVSITNLAGTPATFSVVAEGTEPLYYQWLKGENLLFDGANVSGVNSNQLTILSVTEADVGSYKVTVINGNGSSVTSDEAYLGVAMPIAIAAEPTPRVVEENGTTVVAVGVSGTGPVTYQWYLEGAPVSGATDAAYVITNADAGDVGDYRVIATGPGNSATSAVASVTLLSGSLQFSSAKVVAMRIGDGAQTLTARGNSIFLDQFSGSGGLEGTLAIPDSGPTAMVAIGPNVVALSGGGSSISGSGLTKSLNGQYLVIGAYNTDLNHTTDLNATTAAAVPRGIGLIDSNADYTLVGSVNSAFGNTFYRGAITDGTNSYWGWGRSPGTYYFGFDGPANIVQGDWNNLRSMGIFNGSIYGVSAVSGKTGVMKHEGIPTAANSIQVVVDTGRNFSSDCEVSPDASIIYVADDGAIASGGGVQKWVYDGSAYVLAYTIVNGLTTGTRYLTADYAGANPVIYAVTSEDQNNQLVRIEDTGAGATAILLARAGANQTFRGLRMGPSAPPSGTPMLNLNAEPGNMILNWEGSYFLQSAADLMGPWTDVINGFRPYTNSTIGDNKFFRLRQ